MSLLGTLEQFSLAQVLQRLETHAKSGLLVVKQGEQWVEFYFQQGRLLCIGPVRTKTTLEDRLVQAGVISPQARQEALSTIDVTEPDETRIAMTLLDLGCVSREALRAWATKEATQVLQFLLRWSTGNIYFEDGVAPPSGRLLVALSVSSLLTSISSPVSVSQPVPTRTTSVLTQEEPASASVTGTPDASNDPPLLSASQLLSESIPTPRITSSLSSDKTFQPSSNVPSPVTGPPTSNSTLSPPRLIPNPATPRRIDTSFMKPEMVLMLTDLTSLREQNPQVQLTPEQWQLFIRADGRTSLQMICEALGHPPNLVCQLTGELIALGLVYLSLPPAVPVHELSPVSRNPVTAGLGNSYGPTAQPWVAVRPITDALPFPSSAPLVPGYGQAHYSQPLPAAQSGSQVAVNDAYAQAGRGR